MYLLLTTYVYYLILNTVSFSMKYEYYSYLRVMMYFLLIKYVFCVHRWASLPAPEMARGYYRLPNNAKWVDVLKCIVSRTQVHLINEILKQQYTCSIST